MALTRFILIRHGETDWNVNGRWQGQAPIPLNGIGLRQAALTAAFLDQQNLGIAHIYASDLSRADVTAQQIATSLGQPVQMDIRLREIDLGHWQGMTEAEVREWDSARLQAVRADPFFAVRPRGESWQQVSARMLEALRAYAAQHQAATILVVSHGGTIRSTLQALDLLKPEMDYIHNCSRTVLTYDGDVWTLEAYNLTDHLVSLEASDPGDHTVLV